MTDNTPPVSDEDVRAQAIALLEKALELLDRLGLTAPAARLDYVLAEVRDEDQPGRTH